LTGRLDGKRFIGKGGALLLGTFGDIVFEVSDERVKTFDGYNRQGQARYASHEVLGRKPILEYLGAALDQVSFSMKLNAGLGVNPVEELAKLRKMLNGGQAARLVIGGKPQGEDKWVLESLSETYDYLDNKGNVIVATVNLTLKEYIDQRSSA
jgi:phage protein U